MDTLPRVEEPSPRIGPVQATWITAGLLVIAMLALLWVANARSRSLPKPEQEARQIAK
jgi:hypothetical protein